MKAPPAGEVHLPSSAGLLFFRQVDIDGGTHMMTVALRDLTGTILYSADLTLERCSSAGARS